LRIFVEPFLLMRTQGSFNHAGQMKSRSRSCYKGQPSPAAVGIDPTTGDPAWVAAQAGPFLAERSVITQCASLLSG